MSFENILDAEKSKSFRAVQNAVVAYWTAHSELTFRDIELQLRAAGARTHLIARGPPPATGKIFPVNKGTALSVEQLAGKYRIMDCREGVSGASIGTAGAPQYHVFFSTMKGPELLEEIRKESASYEENLAKLDRTGILTIDENHDLAKYVGTQEVCRRCETKAGTRSCVNCGCPQYCGLECLKRDWKIHRAVCGKLLAEDQRARARGVSSNDRANMMRMYEFALRSQQAQAAFADHHRCCLQGSRAFSAGQGMIAVKRGSLDVLVCEMCTSRLGVTLAERRNVVSMRVTQ
jgi:hypothetical protein